MGPIVSTTSGRVAGTVEDGVCVFRGIPYGESTAGDARFRPPKPASPWSGVRESVEFGPSSFPTLTALDRAFFPVSPLWSVYAGLDPRIPFGEDCLRLNVWTASTDGNARRPVIVWMHGGGFSWGSGSSPLTAGDELARHHDVVVVTVNHRLGVLGYLHVPGDAHDLGAADDSDEWSDSGVAGLLDLALALEWVRDNIAAFGGDPSNVTIAGHSGGSAKVACLLALPRARGLFGRAIILSGVVTLRSMTTVEAAGSTAGLLAAAGLDRSDVARLRDLPAETLTAYASPFRFRPAVGEPSLPVHPFDPVAAPTADGVPLLAGIATDDSATFKYESDPTFAAIDESELRRRVIALPGVGDAALADRLIADVRARMPDAEPSRLLVTLTTEGLSARTDVMLERKLAASDAPVWRYEFAYRVPMPAETAFPGELMAFHGAELPFVFDIAGREWLAGSRPDRVELGHRVSSYLTNFARTGDPNGAGLPTWPRYDDTARRTIVLDGRRD